MSDDARPPLWTWIATVVLAVALVAGCWLIGPTFEARYDSAFFNLPRLNGTEPAVPTIVLIGSSKTRCAIQFDDLMSHRLAALGTPARVVRVTRAWATVQDFAGVFPRIEETKPAAVLIESELVTLEANAFRQVGMPKNADWRERTRHGLAGMLPSALVARQAPENHGVSWIECGLKLTSDAAAGRREKISRIEASTPAERAQFIEIGRRLRSDGIRVILLDLPVRPDALGDRPLALRQGQARAIQELSATGLFERFDDPPKLGTEFFQDSGHLNPHGQELASSWLASKLSLLLKSRDANERP